MRPNIARWLWNTIALPEYAGHLNPANNISAWKKNSWPWQMLRNACTGFMPPNLRVSRNSLSKLVTRHYRLCWEFVMPINEAYAFVPEDIKILVSAFKEALRELGLVDRKDPATLGVAKRIMALAQQGERDPIRLREGAVKGDGFSR
jgi:hypothetical protein